MSEKQVVLDSGMDLKQFIWLSNKTESDKIQRIKKQELQGKKGRNQI